MKYNDCLWIDYQLREASWLMRQKWVYRSRNHLDEDSKNLDEDCIVKKNSSIFLHRPCNNFSKKLKINYLRAEVGAAPNSLLNALEK